MTSLVPLSSPSLALPMLVAASDERTPMRFVEIL
jgi:hypothetical protein